MRVLVVTSEPSWVETLRSLLGTTADVIPTDAQKIMQNPALAAAADACFVAETNTSPWTVETIKQISTLSDTPLFVLGDNGRSQWEEAALFAGAHQVFRRPLRGTVIQLAISRIQRRRVPEVPVVTGVRPPAPPDDGADLGVLALWRDFTRILSCTNDRSRLIAEYMVKLREVLRCGRVFLYVATRGQEEKSFECAFAAGVDRSGFAEFKLSQRTGIAQLAAERGTIVWRQRLRSDSGREAAAVRELMVFGADVAVPILGRDGLIGLLLMGPRISGTEYSEQELTLVYHAFEALAPALSAATPGTPVHDDQRGSSLLRALPMAAAIVSETLRIVDVNPPFRSLLGRVGGSVIAFDELPRPWSNAVAAAVRSRAASARVELEHQAVGAPSKLRVSVVRLEPAAESATQFLVTVENAVPVGSLSTEADLHGIQNLLQRAGEQLSNEFRNALTPVDIMVQLARDSATTRQELETLGVQVSAAIHRLRRRIDDLSYLTKNAIIPEPTNVSSILRFTRERLDDWLEDKLRKRIVWLNEFCETPLVADGRALALAVAELVMNAIEASDNRPVTVTAEDGNDGVSFRVRNFGIWSPPPESSGFRHRPFVSTKSTGVGLGLEVATRVAENHGGKLAVGPVTSDAVEAIIRLPRNVPLIPKIETRVERVL